MIAYSCLDNFVFSFLINNEISKNLADFFICRIYPESRRPEEDHIKVVLSKSVSLPCVNGEDMHTAAKAHLTKEEIHDAISLINECLSDQQVRSGTLYPPPQGDSYFSLVRNQPSRFEQKTSFSLQNLNVQFLDQTSDPFDIEALEKCKDIKHAFVHSDDALDSVIAELAGVNCDYQTYEKDLDGRRHKNSLDSGHSAEASSRSPGVSLQKTHSFSDVDSGIDGSALTASVSSETKSTLSHPKGAPSTTTPPLTGISFNIVCVKFTTASHFCRSIVGKSAVAHRTQGTEHYH